jgi:hypothetical protein
MEDVEAYGILWGSTNRLKKGLRINRNDDPLGFTIPTMQETNTEKKSRNAFRRQSLSRKAEVRTANCRGQVLLRIMQWTV